MLWFGRCDAGERWASSTGRTVREVLGRLLPQALPFPLFANRALAERPATEGRWATVTLAAVEPGFLTSPIDWFGEPPPADALAAGDAREPLPFLRIDIRTTSGQTLAGVLPVPDGI